jgi:uncharacterized protein
LQVAGKKAYRVDLSGLHAVCEANYARLLRLFPDYEIANSRQLVVGSARVTLEVIERCRYTTFMRLTQSQSLTESPLLGYLRIEVRAYHDARMLEVSMFQSHRQVDARYEYPNKAMYQQDEKLQQNNFLAQWLEHCQRDAHLATAILPTYS